MKKLKVEEIRGTVTKVFNEGFEYGKDNMFVVIEEESENKINKNNK